jgi:hypothetical protein
MTGNSSRDLRDAATSEGDNGGQVVGGHFCGPTRSGVLKEGERRTEMYDVGCAFAAAVRFYLNAMIVLGFIFGSFHRKNFWARCKTKCCR